MIRGIVILIIVVAVIGGGILIARNKSNQVVTSSSPSLSPKLTPSTSSGQVTPTPSATPPSLPNVIKATIVTVRGNIQLELYSKAAPKTVYNFVILANSGFYDGTKFHRVVPDFVIQGGDPLSKTDDPKTGTGGPGYSFEDEINPKTLGLTDAAIAKLEAMGYKYNFTLPSLPVDVGVIAMANAGPNTNGSQFFIVTTKPQLYLNGKHTVFGKVVKGMDVVLKIKQGDVVKKITTDYKSSLASSPSPSLSPTKSPTNSKNPY